MFGFEEIKVKMKTAILRMWILNIVCSDGKYCTFMRGIRFVPSFTNLNLCILKKVEKVKKMVFIL